VVVVLRGAAELGADVPAELVSLLAAKAGGDARTALNVLELAWSTAQSEGAALEARHVEDAARRRPVVYDKGGDAHYDFTSAFIKSIRGSDPDAALYYLAAMLEGGEDPRFIARRLIVHASEDVGLADSNALLVAAAAAHAVEHVGLPEAQLNLAHATIYLATAPKSNAVLRAIGAARRDVRERGAVRPPKALRDTHYPGAKKLGHGRGYAYPPEDPAGYETDYLPEELRGRTYWQPEE
jgi:putative ATPase